MPVLTSRNGEDGGARPTVLVCDEDGVQLDYSVEVDVFRAHGTVSVSRVANRPTGATLRRPQEALFALTLACLASTHMVGR